MSAEITSRSSPAGSPPTSWALGAAIRIRSSICAILASRPKSSLFSHVHQPAPGAKCSSPYQCRFSASPKARVTSTKWSAPIRWFPSPLPSPATPARRRR